MSDIILVVDDDDEFRESIGEILRDEGYDVLLAASSPQALEHASRHRPAICLLDVAMPGVDGVQLLRYFRSRQVFRNMPVLLLTAGIRKDYVQHAAQLGVRDILLKSKFSVNELIARIRKRLTVPVDIDVKSESSVHDSVSVHSASEAGSSNGDGDLPNVPPSGFDSSLEFDFLGDRDSSDSGPTDQRSQRVVSHEMIRAMGGLRALPSMVEALIGEASPSESRILELLHEDPLMAARILRSANAAAFSGQERSPITRIEDAWKVLGFANLVRVASTGAILRQEDLEGEAADDLAALWRQSIATGLVAEHLAPESGKAVAFLQGLFHDLPSLFALQYLGSDWPPWRSHALVKGWPLRDAISNALGCPLESLSGQILDAYRIPPRVSSVIQEFQVHSLAANPRDTGSSVRLLEIARLLATALGRPGTLFAEVRSVHRDEAKAFDWDDIFRHDLSKEVGILEDLADLPPAVEYIRRIDRKLAIWRDPRWAVPDPVEMVLSRYCDCLRVERFEDLVAQRDRVRLAIGEPGTLEWERLGMAAPVIALHRGSLRPEPLPKGVDAMRVPLPVHLLVRRIEKAIP